MFTAGRFRLHPLTAAIGVLAVAAVAVGLAWVVRPSTIDIPAQTHDPAKLAAATALIAGLPAPAHAVRDAYATGCRVPAPYCATSTTESARSLMKQLEETLRSRGARGKEDGCSTPGNAGLLPAPPNCIATLTYGGALIGLGAGDARTGSAPAPAYVYALVPTDVPAPQPNAPLPTLARLKITPQEWRFAAACVEPIPAGCKRYSGTISIVGDVDHLSGQMVKQLSGAGYFVDTARCRVATSGRACVVAASRFRTVGGHDSMTVVAVLRQVDVKTVTVRIAAQS